MEVSALHREPHGSREGAALVGFIPEERYAQVLAGTQLVSNSACGGGARLVTLVHGSKNNLHPLVIIAGTDHCTADSKAGPGPKSNRLELRLGLSICLWMRTNRLRGSSVPSRMSDVNSDFEVRHICLTRVFFSCIMTFLSTPEVSRRTQFFAVPVCTCSPQYKDP